MSAGEDGGLVPSDEEVSAIRERLAVIEERIRSAGGRPGPGGVRIVSVTKGHAATTVLAARVAGLDLCGESYAQELVAKAKLLDGVLWHFLGQLQTNKVRLIAPHVAVVQSLDRRPLAAELAKRAPGAEVFVQVDLAAAVGAPIAGRGGVAIDDAPALADDARRLGLNVTGVMGVAPQVGEREVAASFAALRSLAERLDVVDCSMGMSDDLEIAVREGSTMVRVGTALLGPRTVVRP